MIRTQVYLDDNQVKRIKVVAASTKKSQAEVIREAVSHGLEALQSDQQSGGQALLSIAAKAVKTGDPDGARNIDKYLYDEI